MSTTAEFLGTGWSFPVAPAADGEIEMVQAADDIRQAIRLILETEPGERVMRPDFGAGLRSIVFDPINTGTLALVRLRVEQALIAWEPRIDIEEVVVTTDEAEQGKLLVHVAYRVRATNTFYNLVYPFYLQEARE